MNTNTLIAALIAVLVVGGLIGGGLYYTRKNHLELTGEVLKVRTTPIDNDTTVAVIDFRIANPSTQQFVVKDIDVFIEEKNGQSLDSAIFSELDAQRVFEYYKVLGKKYNATLLTRDKINEGQSVDRMIAVRFTAPEARVLDRKNLRIIITDVDGQKTEFVEKK